MVRENPPKVHLLLRAVSRVWRIGASGFAFAMFGLGAAALTLTVIPLILLLSREQEQKELRVQKLIHYFCRGFLTAVRWLGIARFTCDDPARLREPGTLIVVNHPTLVDAIAVLAHMPQADLVAKREHFENRFLRKAIRSAGYVPNRGGPTVVKTCLRRLASDRSLVIFPEGTRSPVGGLGEFQRGAAHIALRTGRDPLMLVISCEPPTLDGRQPWWRVPERPFELRLEVGERLALKELAAAESSRGRAARAATRAMREYFNKRISRVGA